jgi:hypothetical protein
MCLQRQTVLYFSTEKFLPPHPPLTSTKIFHILFAEHESIKNWLLLMCLIITVLLCALFPKQVISKWPEVYLVSIPDSAKQGIVGWRFSWKKVTQH